MSLPFLWQSKWSDMVRDFGLMMRPSIRPTYIGHDLDRQAVILHVEAVNFL